MMTYSEFCAEVAPTVLELENECRKMTEEEFESFREDVMKVVIKSELSKRFMAVILDTIYEKVFQAVERG